MNGRGILHQWLAVIILINLTACSRKESTEGRLVRRLKEDVATLNPVRAKSMEELYVAGYLHTPLLYLDRDLKPIPGLATLPTVSADGRTYRFELDARATFSDGTPVRASDVVFTLKKGRDEQSKALDMADMFEDMDESRTIALGDRIVQVGFRERLAKHLLHFSRVYVVPERIYSKGSFSDEFNDRVVGTGPYTLESRSRGKNIVLKRRDNYWRGKALIPTILFQVVEDDMTAWKTFVRGELDETRMSSENWKRVRNDPTYAATTRRFYTFSYEAIIWNGHHPILGDKRMRRALALCVPTQSIIRDIYHGTARPLSGPFMPESYASNPGVMPNKYDPEKAKRLLADMGWRDRDGDGALDRDGTPLRFEIIFYAGNKSAKRLLETFQNELSRIGVSIGVTALEGAGFGKQVRDGKYDGAYIGSETDPEPDPYFALHSSQFPPNGSNFVFYSNPEADRLMEAARRELDIGKRAVLYQRLHALLAEDQPYTWIMQVQDKWAVSERLEGVSESRGYGLYRWYPGELGWRLAPVARAAAPEK